MLHLNTPKVSEQLEDEEIQHNQSYTYPTMTKTMGGFHLTVNVRCALSVAAMA